MSVGGTADAVAQKVDDHHLVIGVFNDLVRDMGLTGRRGGHGFMLLILKMCHEKVEMGKSDAATSVPKAIVRPRLKSTSSRWPGPPDAATTKTQPKSMAVTPCECG